MLIKFGYPTGRNDVNIGPGTILYESKPLYLNNGIGGIKYFIVKSLTGIELLEQVIDFADHSSVRHIVIEDLNLDDMSELAEFNALQAISKLYNNEEITGITEMIGDVKNLISLREDNNYKYIINDIYMELISLIKIRLNIHEVVVNNIGNFVNNIIRKERIDIQKKNIKEKLITLSDIIVRENVEAENHELILQRVIKIIYNINQSGF